MGGKAPSAPKQSTQQKKAENLSFKLMQEQYEQAKKPVVMPDLSVPPALRHAPPPMAVSSDVADAEDAARKAAARRTNQTRGTLFSGEGGGYKKSTLLG